MRIPRISVIAVLAVAPLFAPLAACGNDDNDDNDTNDDTGDTDNDDTDNDDTDNDNQTALSDAQIAHVVRTADSGEIAQANAAMPRLTNATVQAFAQRMIDEHTANLQQLDDLVASLDITPLPSDVSQRLQDASDRIVAELGDAAPSAADEVYMRSQVAVHTQVLDLIDDRLLVDVDDNALRSFLQQTRAAVQQHLQQAQDLTDQIFGGA
jgi:putative membrane protein